MAFTVGKDKRVSVGACDDVCPVIASPNARAVAVNTRLLDLFVNGFTLFPAKSRVSILTRAPRATYVLRARHSVGVQGTPRNIAQWLLPRIPPEAVPTAAQIQ
jgi:hypothetical protein